MKSLYDITICVEGSIVTFTAVTDEGAAWLRENIGHAPRLGSAYCVEANYAGTIFEAIVEAGLCPSFPAALAS